jgi:hypothetical protein
MQIVNFLASLWGMVLVFVPLSLLINPKQIKGLFAKIEDEASTYFCGIIAFTLGTATILLNNVWARDWKVIVTVIGWVAILKGLCAMFCTDKFIKMRVSIKDKEWLSYAILAVLFLGLVCVYFGFVGK